MCIEPRGLSALKIQDDPEAIFQEGWLLCDVGEHDARPRAICSAPSSKGYFVAPTLAAGRSSTPLRDEPALPARCSPRREAGRARALARSATPAASACSAP